MTRLAFNCSCGLSVILTGSAAGIEEHRPKVDNIAADHAARGHEQVSAFKAAGVRRSLWAKRERELLL